MSVIVNYLKSRIEILILNAKTGMDTTSQEYDKLCNDAVNAIKQVCLGVKGVSPQELKDLLHVITDAPVSGQLRDELRDLLQPAFQQRSLLLLDQVCMHEGGLPGELLEAGGLG